MSAKWQPTPGYVCACRVCESKRVRAKELRAAQKRTDAESRVRLERTVRGLMDQVMALEKEVARLAGGHL